MRNAVFRSAGRADIDLLWAMVAHAARVIPDQTDDLVEAVERARSEHDVARYVDGWSADGDVGVVVELDGRSVGAAWFRRPDPADRDLVAYLDDATPEIVIAVTNEARGAGVGTALLGQLLDLADREHEQTTLNVRADNPARRLYERLGFVTIEMIENRAGTDSHKMVRRRPSTLPR